MAGNLVCIPAKHRYDGRTCIKHATWFVWYEGCGGVYTAHCNDHLAESLLDAAVQVVRIDSIARMQQAFLKPLVARVCPRCDGRGVLGNLSSEGYLHTCTRCDGRGRIPV